MVAPFKIGLGVGVLILKEKSVLLGQRQSGLAKDSWSLPGGKVDHNEYLIHAACRETQEETSLVVAHSDLKLVSVSDDIAYGHHFVSVCFATSMFTGELTTPEPDKLADWQWFDIKHLPKPMYIPSDNAIKNYLSGNIYDQT